LARSDENDTISAPPGNIPLFRWREVQTAEGALFLQYGISNEWTVLGDLPLVYNSVTGPTTAKGSNVTNSIVAPETRCLESAISPSRSCAAIIDMQAQLPLYSRLLVDDWNSLAAGGSVHSEQA